MFLPLPVGRRGAPLDGADLDEPDLPMNIKKPPGADEAAKGGALTLKPLDVAGERIGLHLLDRGL